MNDAEFKSSIRRIVERSIDSMPTMRISEEYCARTLGRDLTKRLIPGMLALFEKIQAGAGTLEEATWEERVLEDSHENAVRLIREARDEKEALDLFRTYTHRITAQYENKKKSLKGLQEKYGQLCRRFIDKTGEQI